MTGITNPAEEYFKDGLWGWVTNAWKKLVATAGGALHIQFAGQEADVEVTQTAAADLTPGVCGWIGAAWQKLPMLFGYSDRWAEAVSGQADGAGNAVATSEAVDEGYIYVLQSFTIYNGALAAKTASVTLVTTGDDVVIFHDLTFANSVYHAVQCEYVLKYQDYIVATVTAPGDDKWAHLHLWGYKMKIAE